MGELFQLFWGIGGDFQEIRNSLLIFWPFMVKSWTRLTKHVLGSVQSPIEKMYISVGELKSVGK